MNLFRHMMCGTFLLVSAGAHAQAFDFLDINRVRARINASASVFSDPSGLNGYEVPKGSGHYSINNHALWITGKDLNGGDYLSAETYRANGSDFQPGPLRLLTGDIDSATIQAFDRVWKVNRFDIENFRTHYANGTIGQGYQVPASILSWPGNGPAGYDQTLAPFEDVNGDGIYDPADGDYPNIKGDQMLWCVVNDMTRQRSSGGYKLGIEVQYSAYAFVNDTAQGPDSLINYTTFLETRIINRSSRNYVNVLAASFFDTDILEPYNDYMGTCVDQQSLYGYSSSAAAGSETSTALRMVQAEIFLKDTVETSAAPQTGGLTNTTWFQNGTCIYCDPQIPFHYIAMLNGRWKDGTPFYFGDNGYLASPGPGDLLTRYAFPGASDPSFLSTGGTDPGFIWTALTPAAGSTTPLAATDVRSLGIVKPNVGLLNGDELLLETAFLTLLGDSSQPAYYLNGRICSATETIRNWYNTQNFPSGLDLGTLSEEEPAAPAKGLQVWPVPAHNQVSVQLPAASDWLISVLSLSGQQLQQSSHPGAAYLNLQLGELKPGLYLIRAQDSQGKIYNAKIVIY
ncbi:MAG: T9SS type A sorting domain-containing protein [Flavobacteriales bacterium]